MHMHVIMFVCVSPFKNKKKKKIKNKKKGNDGCQELGQPLSNVYQKTT
jgi:hypothetical protein